MDTDTDMYHALPQIRGKAAHENVDAKKTTTRRSVIESLNVVSHRYGIIGKIDIFDTLTGRLTERKNNLKNIFQGQIYQLWAQYLCMIEMGYVVNELCFYEITTRRHIPIEMPTAEDLVKFKRFIEFYQNFNPRDFETQNPNKCQHCIYCGLCDKYIFENVY